MCVCVSNVGNNEHLPFHICMCVHADVLCCLYPIPHSSSPLPSPNALSLSLSVPVGGARYNCCSRHEYYFPASWKDLQGDALGQGVALAIGLMSVGSVWVAFFVIERSKRDGKTTTTKPGAVVGGSWRFMRV